MRVVYAAVPSIFTLGKEYVSAKALILPNGESSDKQEFASNGGMCQLGSDLCQQWREVTATV